MENSMADIANAPQPRYRCICVTHLRPSWACPAHGRNAGVPERGK
jgi:hypothetical protein